MLKKVYTLIFIVMVCVLIGTAGYSQDIIPVNSVISNGVQHVVHTELDGFDQTSANLKGEVTILSGKWNINSSLYYGIKSFVFWEQDKPEEKTIIKDHLIYADCIYPDIFVYEMKNLKPGTKYCFQAMADNVAGELITFMTRTSQQVSTVLSPVYDKDSSKGISDTLRVQLTTEQGLPISGGTIYWDSYSDVRPLSKTTQTDGQGIASVKCEVPFGGSIENDYYPIIAEFQGYEKYSTSICKVQLKQGYLLKGYIKPDFTYSPSAAPEVNGGFNIEFTNDNCSAVTDKDGYFEAILSNANSCRNIIIRKPGFLKREIRIIAPYDVMLTLSTKEQPLEMWAGDIPADGIQDNAVNMIDIMKVAGWFNSVVKDKTDAVLDFNKDNVINMIDIMIVAKSFNKVSSNYPEYKDYMTDPPQVNPTPTNNASTPVPTATPTSGEQWVSYQPSSGQISVSVIKDTEGDFYGLVNFTFPDSGYRINYYDTNIAIAAGIMPDGSTRISLVNGPEAKVERWTGASLTVMTDKCILYKLPISKESNNTKYTFSYNNGSERISYEFTTSSIVTPKADYTVSSSTPLPVATPEPGEKWVPYQPSLDETKVSIAKDAQGNYYGIVSYTFPDSGYRVNYDDHLAVAAGILPDGSSSISYVNALAPVIERWTGGSATVMTDKTIVYKLDVSKTPNQKYTFTYKNGEDRVVCKFTT